MLPALQASPAYSLALVVTGYDASMFSLSLARTYQTEHIADFGRVEGLPGVYLANQLMTGALDPSSKPKDKPWSDFLQTRV